MPEQSSPSFEVARASIPVEADMSAFNEALDRLEERLDAIRRKASSVLEGVRLPPDSPEVDSPQPPAPEQAPATPPGEFAAPRHDEVVVEDLMEKAREREERRRMVDLLEEMVQLQQQMLEKLDGGDA